MGEILKNQKLIDFNHTKRLSNQTFIEKAIDKIKDDYCSEKNIHLLRIRFDDTDIEKSITQFLSILQK